MLSIEGLKTFVFAHRNFAHQTFQPEARVGFRLGLRNLLSMANMAAARIRPMSGEKVTSLAPLDEISSCHALRFSWILVRNETIFLRKKSNSQKCCWKNFNIILKTITFGLKISDLKFPNLAPAWKQHHSDVSRAFKFLSLQEKPSNFCKRSHNSRKWLKNFGKRPNLLAFWKKHTTRKLNNFGQSRKC